MEFKVSNRPKLPRNKYGSSTSTYTASSIVSSSEGSTSIEEGTVPEQLSVSEAEWYNIQNKIVHTWIPNASTGIKEHIKDTWITVIENYDATKALGNNDQYRLVLMRFRKGPREGKRWRVPMFSPVYTRNVPVYIPGDYDEEAVQGMRMDIALEDTWWDIKGRESEWWNNSGQSEVTPANPHKTYADVLPIRIDTEHHRFKNGKSKKMKVGVAIFKKSNTGGFSWQRVSNIATVTLYCTNSDNILVMPND